MTRSNSIRSDNSQSESQISTSDIVGSGSGISASLVHFMQNSAMVYSSDCFTDGRCKYCDTDEMNHGPVIIDRTRTMHDSYCSAPFKQSTAYFGALFFPSPNKYSPDRCEFVNMHLTCSFVPPLLEAWKLITKNRPTICVAVNGSSNIREEAHRVFFQLILDLCTRFNVILMAPIDNLKLIEFVAKIRSKVVDVNRLLGNSCNPPAFLGIMRYCEVYNKECLQVQGKTVKYEETGKEGSSDSYVIPPYFTHLILQSDSEKWEIPKNIIFSSATCDMESHENNLYNICIQINGDLSSLSYVSPEVYLVVLKNSGGAADLMIQAAEISQAYKDWGSRFDDEDYNRLQKVAEKYGLDLNDENRELVDTIPAFSANMVVHDIEDERSAIDVVSSSVRIFSYNTKAGIRLSLAWNRVDCFKSILSRLNVEISTDDYKEFFFEALKSNRFWSVSTFLQMDENLLSKVNALFLKRLYNEADGAERLRELMRATNEIDSTSESKHKRQKSFHKLFQVANEKSPLIDKDEKSQYYSLDSDKKPSEDILNGTTQSDVITEKSEIPHYDDEIYLRDICIFFKTIFGLASFPEYEMDYPGQKDAETLKTPLILAVGHIFLWAILNNYHEMAMKLLKHCRMPTSFSLAASVIYSAVSELIPVYDTETKRSYQEKAAYFEDLSCEILENVADIGGVDMILGEVQPLFAGRHLQWTAQYSKKVKFAASRSTQNSVNGLWTNGITSNYFLLFLTYIFPFLLKWDPNLTTYGLWTKMQLFYSSPQVKHMIMFFQYAVVLILLSYSLLFDMPIKTIGITEGVAVGFLGLWSLLMLLEVLIAIVDVDFWNARALAHTTPFYTYNIVTYALNWVYIAIRLSPYDNYNVQRTCFATLLILCYMRIFEFLSFSQLFGPQIIIMKAMLSEFFTYLAIIPIILVPYGISLQALLYPNYDEFHLDTFLRIFENPYYNLYGELYLEEIMGEKEGCEPNGIDCPLYNPMASILHLIYTCVATILLLNLLIAVFSAVYSNLAASSQDLWKYHRLPISLDYSFKADLPAPFSLFEALFFFIVILRTRKKEDFHFGDEEGSFERRSEKKAIKCVYAKRKAERLNTVDACIDRSLDTTQSSVNSLLVNISKFYRETKREQEKRRQEEEREMRNAFFTLLSKKVEVHNEEEILAGLEEANKNWADTIENIEAYISYVTLMEDS